MRVIRKSGLFLSIALLTAASAAAQYYWPKPAPLPANPVCAGCIETHNGQLTPGFPPSLISGFVGRFLDSQAVQDFQQPFRTARAFRVVPAPSLNRIYMIIGSAVFAYDIDTFFTRLASGEALIPPSAIPTQSVYGQHSAPYELFLRDDAFFYAENEPDNGWVISITDGQTRLFGVDYDDQGYVYMAYSFYGWGIAKDPFTHNGALMQSAYHTNDDMIPVTIAAVKAANGHYYALVSGASTTTKVFDVTNRSNPVPRPTINKGATSFAKSSDHLAMATADRIMQIYSNDSFGNNGRPDLEFTGVGGGNVKGVASDGTNFYATSDAPSGLAISVFTPSGNGFTRNDYPTSIYGLTQSLKWGDGYLVWAGLVSGAPTLRIFKLQNGAPVEIDFQDYFKHYYIIPPGAGYTKPNFSNFWESAIVKRGTHTYLIVTAYSLGDVYELPSTDSVAVENLGVSGTANPKRPSSGGAGPFPGDPAAFRANTGAASPMNIVWDFGDGSTVSGLTGSQITHQYSGSPRTVTVKATNAADASISSSVNVTLNQPVARFGVGNYKYLFVQPDASSPAPIVLGDKFFDASDGTVESHFNSWNLDGTSLNTVPPGQADVGVCGPHTLIFDAHYGPYSPSLVSLGTDLAVGIHSLIYATRPFAAAIDVPTSMAAGGSCTDSTGCVVFNSLSRVSSDPNAITATQASALTYKWELLNGTTAVTSATGTAAGGVVPPFVIGKTLIGNNYRAHLNLTSPSGAGPACASFTTTDAYSDLLNAPDPKITGGCSGANNGPPCSFSVSSAGGADTTGWTYLWTTNPTTGVTPTTGTGSTYQPAFSTAGTYTVQVTATNSIKSTTVQTPSFTVPGQVCQTMNAVNTFITFTGASSGCNQSSGNCQSGENVTLSVYYYPPYDPTCAQHSYNWSIGGTTQSITKTFSSTTSVSVTISNGSQNYTTSTTVPVGYTPPPPPPPPPPPTGGSCPTMSASNVFITFAGSSSGCSQLPSSPPCQAGEQVTLAVSGFGYDFNCATHSFSWNFGGSGQSVVHAFTTTTNVAVNISNGSQTYSATATVPVSGSAPPPTGGSCPTMSASNVFVTFSGATSGCTQLPTSGSCTAGETITLNVSGFGYDFACASHTFTWNFGASGKTVTHAFNTSTAVSVSVSNGSQTFVANATIPIGTGSLPPPSGSCGALVPNTSVFIGFSGPQSGCSQYGGQCTTDETIAFEAKNFNFDLGCITSYDWNWGDGTAHGTGLQATHRYVAGGAFPVKLTAMYNGQAYVMSATVNVTSSGSTPNYAFDFTTEAMPGVPNGFIFKAFAKTSTASATLYNWDFGDGAVCNSCPAIESHVYADDKNYTVTLSVPGYPGNVQHGVQDKYRHRPSSPP